MRNFITIFIAIIFLKMLLNFYYWCLSKYYLKKYQEYIKDKKNWWISNHRHSVVKVFQKAGIKDTLIPHIEPLGYGQLMPTNISVFENIPNRRQDIASIILSNLKACPSIFSGRILNAINPFFWVEFIIFLPKHLLNYLGVSSENIGIKILNIFWWLIGVVGIVLKDKIVSIFSKILTSIY